MAAATPFVDLDLSMELERIVDLAEEEEALQARCQLFELNWESRMELRAQTAIQHLEGHLRAEVTGDAEERQVQLQETMVSLERQRDDFMGVANSMYAREERAFRESAHREVAQYQAHASQLCHSHEQQSFEKATAILRHCYDRMYEERVSEMAARHEEQIIQQSAMMQQTCRSELNQVESRSAQSCADYNARLVASESALDSARRVAMSEEQTAVSVLRASARAVKRRLNCQLQEASEQLQAAWSRDRSLRQGLESAEHSLRTVFAEEVGAAGLRAEQNQAQQCQSQMISGSRAL